ncbi:copper homeostasis membrane protein CopD [Pseudomonas sp. LP_7_YM]|uniref:copper homeostasis membrane protein CopD n=1 Tax=Pseudomonas sp. LP_7_YM TaxID=2485137 RepID=UPI0010612C4F|nr:copper homeostasis membrane protein CopD [Pseudomonas sp. LP_7_YM]TDV72843.1 putative copper resistance protein D [Pseudomonas sp. LP_7_YM]
MQEALILCRFVHFGAVLLLFGSGLFRHVLFSSALQSFEASPARRRLDQMLVGLTILALLSAVGWLMLTAANMSDDWHGAADPSTLARVLGQTFFGHVWVVHLALNALALLWALFRAPCAPRRWLLLNVLLLLTLAPVGHGAMFDGVRGPLLIVNQMLHLIGVGSWLGGLLMLAVLLITASGVDLRGALARFSGLGYGLVALIIVTGMINVRALSGAIWPQPALSGFGLVLAVKVTLVLCMLVLAGVNRRLARANVLPVRALRVSVLFEGLFGAAALAAVALLGTLPPLLG